MYGPDHPPVGMHLARVAREAGRAFDAALAEAVGIQEATLTHHLNSMETKGLLTRRRDPANRRVHMVELTPEGNALFARLRTAAMAFDERLRDGLSAAELERFEAVLDRLHDNVT